MNLLITGSRNWERTDIIKALLLAHKDEIECVIHGCAKGADTIAGDAAQALNLIVEEYPAQWHIHGRRAGMIRNQQMLDEACPSHVWAFPTKSSIGTWDMVRRAQKEDIPVFLFEFHQGQLVPRLLVNDT